MKQTQDDILKELYGVDVSKLIEYQDFCKKKKINWYETFLFTEEDWKAFTDYITKKFRLQKFLEKSISMILLNYSGTMNEETFKKNFKKVKNNKLYKEIEKKRWRLK